jgi:LysM domain
VSSPQRSVATPVPALVPALAAALVPAAFPAVAGFPAEWGAAQPVELRPAVARLAGPAGRGPGAAAPSTTRRDPVRPGARAARSDGFVGARPVRGGCSPEVGSPEAGVQVHAGARPGCRQEHAPLRLTDRGRRLVAGLSIAIGLVIAAGTAVTVELGDGDRGLRLAGSSIVVVQSGDTLWSLAERVAPEEDPRAVVDAIVELNGLDSVDLAPGMELQLP